PRRPRARGRPASAPAPAPARGGRSRLVPEAGGPLVNPLQTLRLALRALYRNKTRSFLTALGIIIGVAAVIAMMAIGEGAKKLIEDQFAAMGTNLLIISPGSSSAGGARGGSGTMPSLTW